MKRKPAKRPMNKSMALLLSCNKSLELIKQQNMILMSHFGIHCSSAIEDGRRKTSAGKACLAMLGRLQTHANSGRSISRFIIDEMKLIGH